MGRDEIDIETKSDGDYYKTNSPHSFLLVRTISMNTTLVNKIPKETSPCVMTIITHASEMISAA